MEKFPLNLMNSTQIFVFEFWKQVFSFIFIRITLSEIHYPKSVLRHYLGSDICYQLSLKGHPPISKVLKNE